MSENEKKPTILIPYIPFKTFYGFVDNLKNNTVPPIIDASLLQTMSGSMKGQLLSSLKFLKLIGTDCAVLGSLENLVNYYKTESWGDCLQGIVFDAYLEITGNVDLNSGTSQQLYDAFRKRGNVDGQMLDKSVRFYLSALDECGVTYSPYFKAKKPRKPTQRKKKKDQKNKVRESGEDGFSDGEDFDNAGGAKFKIAVPGKSDVVIHLPEDIDQNDWEMVKTMLDAYVKRLTNFGGTE